MCKAKIAKVNRLKLHLVRIFLNILPKYGSPGVHDTCDHRVVTIWL